MNTLDQASKERIDDFRKGVIEWREDNKMHTEELADECELAGTTVRYFLQGGGINLTTALKISMTTGIAI